MAMMYKSLDEQMREKLMELPDKPEPVRSGKLERMFMKKIDPDKLYPNPDDEFSDPKIGPNASIIENYAKIAKKNYALGFDVYDEEIIVTKLKSGQIMILNGHHRWAGALRAMVPKVRVSLS